MSEKTLKVDFYITKAVVGEMTDEKMMYLLKNINDVNAVPERVWKEGAKKLTEAVCRETIGTDPILSMSGTINRNAKDRYIYAIAPMGRRMVACGIGYVDEHGKKLTELSKEAAAYGRDSKKEGTVKEKFTERDDIVYVSEFDPKTKRYVLRDQKTDETIVPVYERKGGKDVITGIKRRPKPKFTAEAQKIKDEFDKYMAASPRRSKDAAKQEFREEMLEYWSSYVQNEAEKWSKETRKSVLGYPCGKDFASRDNWEAFHVVIKKAIDKIEKKELIANALKNKQNSTR